MKENRRKCFKCERSPHQDPDVKLFRFPQPGIRNRLRSELWAKYCFPNEECSTKLQTKLYAEHRMLCDKHFNRSSFADFSTKKLQRDAVPEDVSIMKVYVPVQSPAEPVAGPSRPALVDVTNNVHPFKSVAPIAFLSTTETQAGPSQLQQRQAISQVMAAADVIEETSKERSLYIKCRKYMKKICQLRNQIHKAKNKVILESLDSDKAIKGLMDKITPSLALLLPLLEIFYFSLEIKNFKRKSKGRRWTKEQKITALRIFKRSPTCYNLLRRLFCLPAPSTLKILLTQFPLCVGINKKIFEVLKKNSQTLPPKDNEFILMFDEMSIRKNLQYNNKDDRIEGFQDHANQGRSAQVATYALVFMICGIRKKLKQPLAFYLSGSSVTADRLAVLIKEVLFHCFDAGLNISASVCDMDGVNRRALGILGATSQNPCFEVNDHLITSMFDPPHLLKCFRNLFMKYDLKHSTNITSYTNSDTTGKGIAKWIHIKEFYELDNVNPNFVFAPSLRQEHLTPNTKQKMRVKLAAQVLSHSVAAGMYCKISQGELTTEASVTANLVANIDKLFDCLNSDTPDWRRGKRHSTNLTEKTPHLKLFKEMKLFFQSLELIGCRSKPPSIEGWVWTINAVEIFWKKLTGRHPSVRSLATRRLQQDPLENLFGCIRGHCGSNTNPTTGQFIAGLKTVILSSLANVGTRGNCEIDQNDAILNNFKMLLANPKSIEPSAFEISFDPSDLQGNIQNSFEESMEEVTGELQACAYVCGFIIKKYKNDCTACKASLSIENYDLEHNFIQMKEYSEIKSSLKYASKELIKCVEYCATWINSFLETHSHEADLKEKVLNGLIKTANFDFSRCTVHHEAMKEHIVSSTFYICVKRFCTLKNRKFTEEASATALKRKINILKHI